MHVFLQYTGEVDLLFLRNSCSFFTMGFFALELAIHREAGMVVKQVLAEEKWG